MASRYHEMYAAWQNAPEEFWASVVEGVDWYTKPKTVFDKTKGAYGRWFPDGTTNTCYNCLDRHVLQGREHQTAIIYDSPVTNRQKHISYADLLTQVQTLAAVLEDKGIGKGDTVIIYMPMVPETLVAMLACARIGAIHSVVFGGFAANELAKRIDDCKPKLMLTASCGLEGQRVVPYMPPLNEAIKLASHEVTACIVLQRDALTAELDKRRDHDWAELVSDMAIREPRVPCVPLKATDPLYILYTSGTTGIPKGVVRDHGGHQVALHWTMDHHYGANPGDVFWAASDVGWIVGHSYIVYGPLLFGCTTLLYEGKPVGTPDAGAFWRVINEHKVSVLFTAPTALRAIKKEDPEGQMAKNYDMQSLRTLFLAGERADTDSILWAERVLKTPVIDHWWQTETSWAICGNPAGLGTLPVKHGSAGVPMPGYDVCVVDDEGHEIPAGELGNIVIKLPLPPGCLPTLWQKDDHFKDTYLSTFPGYYQTSDAGYKDDDGYIHIMARTDDIINVAGHRLSTGSMEEAITSHKDVAECAVFGVKDALKGELPWGFLVLNKNTKTPDNEVIKDCISLVRERLGPIAAFKTAFIVERLPKTRSGKILRGTMRKLCNGEPWNMPATVDDPDIFDEIKQAIDPRER